MSSSPPPPSKPHPHLNSIFKSYISKSTTHIAHLNRLLSQTPHLDTTLLTLSYTLHLLHSFRPTALSASLPPLTALLDETRIILRLWGLLGIYTWAASTYLVPPQDVVLRGIICAEIGACAIFQGLENWAFLTDKGILKWGKREGATKKAWAWSARAWACYVALELGRLGLEGWRMERGRRKGGEGEKGELELREEKIELEWWEGWKRAVGVNVAYAPMTVHYSLEDGAGLSEGAIGALGTVVAWLSIGQAWKATA